MVLPHIIVPGGMQVQDTSCVRPEDQDGGDNNMGSIQKNKMEIFNESFLQASDPPLLMELISIHFSTPLFFFCS